MAHKLLTDITVQGEGLFHENLTLGTSSTFSKLVFDTGGFDIGEIEVGSYQAMLVDAQDGVFELMSNSSSQNHAITGTMGGYVTLNYSGVKKLQTASAGINITGDLNVTGAYYDSNSSPGTLGQILSSTATGTSWIAQDDIIAAASKLVVIACKNTHSATILKGTPVYQTGTVGATDVIEVAPADALISLGHQPAIGLLQQDLAINAFGNVVITGELLNFTTDPIDGLTPVTGQKVFLKSGGGLTLTKPTGEGNGIQNLGLIGKVSGGNAGSITVSSIMRTNDVPNLTTGKIWVGDGNTVESTVVHLDEVNGRMGIGTTSPTATLHIESADDAVIRLKSTDNKAYISLSDNDTNGYISSENTKLSLGANPGVNANNLNIDLSSNNVGIGTSSPAVRLEVNGEIDANGGDGYRIETKPWANWGSDLLTLGDWDGEGYATRIMGSNSSEVMRVTGTNVGIGTTSPDYKLEVDGTLGVSRTDGIIFAGSTGSGQGNKITSDTSNNLIFSTSLPSAPYTTTEKVRILNNGNVGIGIGNPATKLHIGSTGGVGSTTEEFRIQTSTSGGYGGNAVLNLVTGQYGNSGIYFGDNATYTSQPAHVRFVDVSNYIEYNSPGNHIFKYFGNEIFRTNGYNVGIGTTNPSEELEVNGTVKATEYKGYLPAFQHGGFYHSSSTNSSTIYWIPTNYISETTSSQYYNNWVAPYSGRVKKIVMRWASGTTPTATSVTFRKSINGGGDLNTYPATVANGASTNMTATRVFQNTDIAFNAGDRVRIGFTTDGGTRLLYGFAYTIVLEYDKD